MKKRIKTCINGEIKEIKQIYMGKSNGGKELIYTCDDGSMFKYLKTQNDWCLRYENNTWVKQPVTLPSVESIISCMFDKNSPFPLPDKEYSEVPTQGEGYIDYNGTQTITGMQYLWYGDNIYFSIFYLNSYDSSSKYMGKIPLVFYSHNGYVWEFAFPIGFDSNATFNNDDKQEIVYCHYVNQHFFYDNTSKYLYEFHIRKNFVVCEEFSEKDTEGFLANQDIEGIAFNGSSLYLSKRTSNISNEDGNIYFYIPFALCSFNTSSMYNDDFLASNIQNIRISGYFDITGENIDYSSFWTCIKEQITDNVVCGNSYGIYRDSIHNKVYGLFETHNLQKTYLHLVELLDTYTITKNNNILLASFLTNFSETGNTHLSQAQLGFTHNGYYLDYFYTNGNGNLIHNSNNISLKNEGRINGKVYLKPDLFSAWHEVLGDVTYNTGILSYSETEKILVTTKLGVFYPVSILYNSKLDQKCIRRRNVDEDMEYSGSMLEEWFDLITNQMIRSDQPSDFEDYGLESNALYIYSNNQT